MRTALAALALSASVAASSCVPQPRPTNCYEAVELVWPASARAWAHKIVKRESGGNAAAQNRSSSSAGCFQLIKVHSRRFTKLGFTWADRYDPVANTLVAYDLYEEQGTSPWRLTR